ncbi:MAG: nucleotide exchange factor GrpE [bacterium]
MSKPEKKGPVTQLADAAAKSDAECGKLREDYVRALADFDNYRRRVERDLDVSRRLALEALMLDLVPVMDNFQRAVAAAQSGATVESVRKGMELIQRQLGDSLCKHGLAEFSCLGQEFDPRRAEAIGFVQTAEHEPNTVVAEHCPGYACGERVLRPAQVTVAKPADVPAGESGE